MPIGDLKQRILEMQPEFQLDQRLVKDPAVLLEDVMRDILKTEKEWWGFSERNCFIFFCHKYQIYCLSCLFIFSAVFATKDGGRGGLW